jgi:glycosyltransferase involved in cell wall biosynthesis
VRIALISTPFVAVPPPKYGGTELIVYHLARELVARGHDVILFATGDSQLPGAELRALYPTAIWPPETWHELDHATFAVEDIVKNGGVDVIHTHIAPTVALAGFIDVPVVYTLHHVRDDVLQRFYGHRGSHRVRFVAISERQRELFLPEVDADVVHHGLDFGVYRLGPGGEHAAFLGRFAPEKGVHFALDAAHRAGVPLRLAGQPHWKDRRYFEAELRPRLERPGVSWDGEASHGPKCALLGGACATLFPIDWEEPFGLVMIESMLCGTPVLAFRRGSAPEVVDEGVTGWICADVDEMAWRLRRLARDRRSFDRRRCRERAAERFSVEHMTARYLEVYAAAIDHPLLAAMPAESACPAS